MGKIHLTPRVLAERWHILQKTLTQWRWTGKGPPFLKVEGRVLYRVIDIEEFEGLCVQQQNAPVTDEILSKIQLGNMHQETKEDNRMGP